jgi:hypothetical protein
VVVVCAELGVELVGLSASSAEGPIASNPAASETVIHLFIYISRRADGKRGYRERKKDEGRRKKAEFSDFIHFS